MKKMTRFLLLTVALFFTTVVMAQSTIKGVVIDAEFNSPLPGANVVEKGTTNGVSTDYNGNFTLTTKASSGEIAISYVGYGTIILSFNGDTDLGNIIITPDNSLDEIVVVGTGVIDLAEDRNTPVAVSTIKAREIQNKIGTQDVTMTLVNTPSVYVAGQSGGFGDSRINIRGFDQTNVGYLLNGQPINGMEDGKMYWSNWSGINDIASAIQIQRGLGASKLAISSVGGTTNFVTKTTDKKEGGYVYAGIANDNYIKNTAQYSTGKNEKGWGASFMLSHWQGDGYNEGNFAAGETYFLSVGYTPNETHNFNFLLTGAPQYHDQNFTKSISDYLEHGRKFNNNWGTYRGQYQTERRNFYHKPVANLNWDFNINDNTNLSTVLYASWGRGGGTGDRGNRIRTADGKRIDYDAIHAFNNSVADGAGGYFTAGGGYITRSSMNLHSWYGMVSNLETKLGERITLNVGVDLRTYYGEHFRIVENFHGLTSWQENIRLRDQNDSHQPYGTFGTYKNVITTEDLSANPWAVLFHDFKEEDKIAYSNDERISYGGVFGQIEYTGDKFSAFFQGAASNQWHQRFDHYQYADETLLNGTSPQWTGTPLPSGITDGVDSEKVDNFGFNVKAGVNYVINDQHNVFFNTGYYSRQPFHDTIYLNFTNQLNPLTQNETIFGLEAGYSFKSQYFLANVNLYRTAWTDRVGTTSDFENNIVTYTQQEGLDQIHTGVEVDFVANLTPQLKVKGFTSIGDWVYDGETFTTVSDEDQNILSTETEDIDGGKVGDAAQFTAGLGFDYKVCKSFSIDADWRTYDNLYANVGGIKENLKLPSYDLVDAGVSYKMLLGKGKDKSLNIRCNMNNVFDEIYLSDLSTANVTEPGDETYKGINVSNRGYFGLGRTWNMSLRYNF
ncbi:carboxypeptidase-like regulatory domain-containing protein [Flavivirga abyssicola]|uniref:TonB-dependent receptor n=1 Tax=Flavivirga abyssicola TaxID=3063533 RepID=UPI0026DFEC6D|nr:carboxypeptidase-like regulatory domain-containing protein [Flavivirga sp. MEBiC07777]WVK14557.1 carboxypeptidase-like regulatory domain-containing protein [Flavivirga sp. MEBiC07777]